MLFRSRIRGTSKAMIFVLFFAQAAFAANACDMPDRAPAQAIAPQAAMPCHEAPAPNANLCLAHCLSADQSADTPQVGMPAWSCAAFLTIEVFDSHRIQSAALLHYVPHLAAPPPRILFQSFLI
jgi:hypothetical protein